MHVRSCMLCFQAPLGHAISSTRGYLPIKTVQMFECDFRTSNPIQTRFRHLPRSRQWPLISHKLNKNKLGHKCVFQVTCNFKFGTVGRIILFKMLIQIWAYPEYICSNALIQHRVYLILNVLVCFIWEADRKLPPEAHCSAPRGLPNSNQEWQIFSSTYHTVMSIIKSFSCTFSFRFPKLILNVTSTSIAYKYIYFYHKLAILIPIPASDTFLFLSTLTTP